MVQDQPGQLEYDFIVGVGEDCACSIYLRDSHLQVQSYPFDWLTSASFETRFELILSDFEGFLDREDLKFLEKNPDMFNDEDCDYYENTRNGIYYFHDFAAGRPLDETYPLAKLKYDRRIERFFADIQRFERVLFVWLSHSKVADESLAVAYQEKLTEKFGKAIDLLLVEHKEGMAPGEVETTPLSGRVLRQRLETADWSVSQSETLGNVENVTPIFSRYRRAEPAAIRLTRQGLRPVARFVRPVLPVKRWRKATKRFFRL